MANLIINGQSINYNVYGAGPNLLLIHDGFYGQTSWQPVIERLSQNFKVITYDRSGYGKSSHITGFTGDIIAHGALELYNFCESLKLDKFHLCGHCLGAAISIHFTSLYPERVDHLILESAGLYADDKSEDKCNYVFRPYDTLDYEFKKSLQEMHGKDYSTFLWEIMRAYKDSYIMNPSYSILDRLKQIKKSILFIYGDRDFYFDVIHANTGYRLKKQSELCIFPRTGHLPHIERKDEFCNELEKFLL